MTAGGPASGLAGAEALPRSLQMLEAGAGGSILQMRKQAQGLEATLTEGPGSVHNSVVLHLFPVLEA